MQPPSAISAALSICRCHSIVGEGDQRGALSISTIRFNCKRTGILRSQVTLFNRTERDLLAPQLAAISPLSPGPPKAPGLFIGDQRDAVGSLLRLPGVSVVVREIVFDVRGVAVLTDDSVVGIVV